MTQINTPPKLCTNTRANAFCIGTYWQNCSHGNYMKQFTLLSNK